MLDMSETMNFHTTSEKILREKKKKKGVNTVFFLSAFYKYISNI